MIVVPHIAPQVELGSLGMADSLILMVLALVVFGPRRLPQIGRQLGKLMYEFRKASNDFKFQMEEELRLAEEADRKKKEEAARAVAAAAPATLEAPQTESLPVSSPYPGEGVYPPPVGTSSETPAETGAADEAPKIQPPSTGETVAAKTADAAETKPENAEAVGQNG